MLLLLVWLLVLLEDEWGEEEEEYGEERFKSSSSLLLPLFFQMAVAAGVMTFRASAMIDPGPDGCLGRGGESRFLALW